MGEYSDRIRDALDALSVERPAPFRVIESRWLPEGQMLVVSDDAFTTVWPDVTLEPVRDLWFEPGARPWLDPAVDLLGQRARADAHAHLERALDGLCARLGFDPAVVWKDPRDAERRRRSHSLTLALEARIGFSVMQPNAALITNIT